MTISAYSSSRSNGPAISTSRSEDRGQALTDDIEYVSPHQTRGLVLGDCGDEPDRQCIEHVRESESDRVVDEMVEQLNEMHGRATLDLSLAMGRLVVERFYDGDLSSWRYHGPKETSFRRLAARCNSDLRLSASCLYRAVALYELTCRLGLNTNSWLSMTHLRSVLGLPEHHQAALLEKAEREQWSTAILENEAARVRDEGERRSGRPRAPALIKAVRKLVVCCRSLESAIANNEPDQISSEDMQRVYGTVNSLNDQLEIISRRLLALTATSCGAPIASARPAHR